jgi:2-polyprenyl-3-methyl-5-hydroxy-6-metoxy-1,4-benzoquinol methylase
MPSRKADLLMKKETTCDLCGGRDSHQLFQCRGYPIMECRRCGLVFTGSVMDPVDRESLYRSEYYARAAGYAESIKRTAAGGNPEYDDRVRIASKFTSRAPGTILDVGCGSGGLLAAFKRAGWQCCGIEPSSDLSAYARDIVDCDIFEGTLDSTPLPRTAFDVITACHVLEHSASPRDFLRTCFQSLRDDGVLLLEVPDFGCRSSRKQGADWLPLYPDTHLFHFTIPTLQHLLKATGFRPIRIRRYGGMGILSTQPSDSSGKSSSPTENGIEQSVLNIARSRLFNTRRYLYRLPAMKRIVRYVYWHLMRMNEYISIYSTKSL